MSRKLNKDGTPRKKRDDFKFRDFPAKDRAIVLGWMADGLPQCLQRLASHYRIQCGQTTLYAALAFWRSEEEAQQVSATAAAQIEQEAKEKRFTPQEKLMAIDRRRAEIYAAKEAWEDYGAARAQQLMAETGAFKAELEKAKLKLKTQEHTLNIQKFQWDGAKEALAKLKELRAIAADRTLNDDQKIEQVRLKLWGSVPKEMEGKA